MNSPYKLELQKNINLKLRTRRIVVWFINFEKRGNKT